MQQFLRHSFCPPGCLSGGVLQDRGLPRDALGSPTTALGSGQLVVLGVLAALPVLPVPREHGQQRLLGDAGELGPHLLHG